MSGDSGQRAVRQAAIAGFNEARCHPDMTLDEFIAEIDSLQKQLRELPMWRLRLLCGEETWLDRIRLRRGQST